MSDVISEQQLTHIRIDSLKFDKTNPNKLTQEQMQALNKSMQRFGYLTPIVIDQNNQIADGEHRALVYKQHGLKEIPAFKVELKTDAERRMLRQVMNKLRGEHDRELDANELVTIFQAGQLDDLTQLIAQDKQRLELAIRQFHPDIFAQDKAEIDLEEELKKDPVCKVGDVWQLGDNEIICGDCSQVLLGSFADNQFDLTVTSPPYGDIRDYHGYDFNPEAIAKQLYRVTKSGGVAVWIVGDQYEDGSESLESFRQALRFKELGFKVHDTMIYAKHGFAKPANNRYHQAFEYMFVLSKGNPQTFNPIEDKPNKHAHEAAAWNWIREADGKTHKNPGWALDTYGMRYNIWTYAGSGDRFAKEHPARFPDALAEDHIRSWSNPKASVLDPFLGSGTTLKAAEILGRKCTGIEIAPIYCDIAIKRWEMYTGKKAVKL